MNYESIENIERSILKFSVTDKLVKAGLMPPESAGELVNLLERIKLTEVKETGLDAINGVINENNLGQLKKIFGEAEVGIANFFEKPSDSVKVLRLFDDPVFWEIHEPEELSTLGYFGGDNAAERMLAYHRVFGDPELLGWFGGKEKVRYYFETTLNRASEMAFLFNIDRRDALIGTVPFEDYQKMCMYFGPDLVHQYPDLAYEILNTDIELNGWAGKIVGLKGAFWELGLTGQNRHELKGVVMGLYKKNLVDRLASDNLFSRRSTLEEVEMLKKAPEDIRAEKFIESVAFSLVARDMQKVKGSVAQVEKYAYLSKEKARLRNLKIEWEESKYNPSNNLRPLIGYEIEFDKPSYMDKAEFEFFAKLGFKNGGGGGGAIEISPGPFASHRTASQVFWAYVDAGVIDLYERQKQSVHLNLGLKTDDGVGGLMRWLIMTGWASMPVYQQEAKRRGLVSDVAYSVHQQGDEDMHKLRINRKDKTSEHGHYIECKEFDLVTPREFSRFLRVSQGLATGLAAWQRIDLQDNSVEKKKKVAWELRNRNMYHTTSSFSDNFWDTNITTKIDKVWNSDATDVEKRLAITYLQTMMYLWEGLNQVGMGKFLKQSVHTGVANRVVDQMLLVHPNYWDHYGIDPADIEGELITFRGKGGKLIVYNNPVSFARKLAMRAVGQIDNIIYNHQRRMVEDLKQVGGTSESELKAFFRRYPETFTPQMNHPDKVKKLKEILDNLDY